MKQFIKGDIVRRADFELFSNRAQEATVDHVENAVKVWLLETETYISAEGLEMVKAAPRVQDKTDQDFKADAGKLDWTLLMGGNGLIRTLEGVVRVLDFAVRPKDQGGKGYERHSWRQVPRAKERYRAALHRHLAAIERGEKIDPESGESHWYHASCCVLFLAELENADDY